MKKIDCFYCKRGKLSHIGNGVYECNRCIRGSFIFKRSKYNNKNRKV